MRTEPRKEHGWLHKLVGEWTMIAEPEQGSDLWTETVRSLHGVWFIAEGHGEMPDGSSATTLMTLGYDPARQRYVGSWVGSMMAHLWVYEGSLDESGTTLTLESVGPDFAGGGTKLVNYQDIISFRTDDHRLLTSRVQQEDGSWKQFMQVEYRRRA